MTVELLKDLLGVAENISNRIHQEGKLFDQLLEDNYGLPKGLCIALDDLVDTMDKHLGNADWVSWYIFENNFGANGLVAGAEGQEVVIDTVEKLHEIAMREAHG